MRGMHLSQPGFICSESGPFTKNTERIQKFEETGYSRYIDQSNSDKSCFQYDTAYGLYEYLIKGTTSEKLLRGKCFDKKSKGS